jgi:CMP-N-acetylneuraminic acid synthetase
MQNRLAIVPARRGSRGVIRKNMREVNGRPLIAHTVDALLEVGVKRLIVSSDDPQVLAWAAMHGVERLERPSELSAADTTIADVAIHAAKHLGWSGLIDVFPPTSPNAVKLGLQPCSLGGWLVLVG